MRRLDLVDLVALAAEASDVDAPKLLDLLDTAEVVAVLAHAGPPLLPHEAAAYVLVRLVALDPLPAGSRRLALLAALHLLALNGLDADFEPAATRERLAGVAAGEQDAASVAAWLDPLVTARDPLEGALRALLSPDAWRAIALAMQRAARHRRHRANPGDLLMGLFREGTGPAALAFRTDAFRTDAFRADAFGAGARSEVVSVPARQGVPSHVPAFEPETRKALELAFRAAMTLGHAGITGGHLLMGLLDGGHGALLPEGLDPTEVRQRVSDLLGPGVLPGDELSLRLERLAIRLLDTDPAAAAELESVVDLQRVGLDRLTDVVRAWRGEIFIDALARDEAVARLLGAHRLGKQPTETLHERLVAKYVADIAQYPVLTRAEETRLAESIRTGAEGEAVESRRRLIESNLRLVTPVARNYLASGMSLLDLVQEGNLGLAQAADHYDPAKGFRFTTFATWWIRNAILQAVARHQP